MTNTVRQEIEATVASLMNDADTYAALESIDARDDLEQAIRALLAAHDAELEAVLKDRVALAAGLEAEREKVRVLREALENADDVLSMCRQWADPDAEDNSDIFPVMQVLQAKRNIDAILTATQEQKP
jgi:transcriptional/translational regulatory protein YebC/TACO1